MWKLLTPYLLISTGIWLSLGSTALAQHRNPYLATSARELQNQAAYSTPTVSPYINLAVNPNGLSTYQSLVKPMIDDREAIRLNADTLQQLRRQMRDTREPKGGSPGTRVPVNPRFMHYSHFYGESR
jgi:hypothetical protein